MRLERNASVERLVTRGILAGTDLRITNVRYRVDDHGDIGLHVELNDGSKINTNAIVNSYFEYGRMVFQTASGSSYVIGFDECDESESSIITNLTTMYDASRELKNSIPVK